MGEIADDHFVALFWSEGTGVGGDGGKGPPIEHPAYGGMDRYIQRSSFQSSYRSGRMGTVEHKPPPKPALVLMNKYDLLEQEKKLRPCPCCGSAAMVIEYPLGVSCSRGACMPGKLPVYLSEKDAVEAGFVSVVERWNTAALSAEREALVWPSKQLAAIQAPGAAPQADQQPQ